MKERPIIMSAPMVRAILEGRKSQTRRIAPIADLRIRQREDGMCTWGVNFDKPIKGELGSHSGGKFTEQQARSIIASEFNPYGQPGNRLWVREAWTVNLTGDPKNGGEGTVPIYRAEHPNAASRWRSPIHMPRWASRITLEVTGVRVERLQDISTSDCWDEGIQASPDVDPWHEYRGLWESINGPGSWDANPWVWVIEFTRAAQAKDGAE